MTPRQKILKAFYPLIMGAGKLFGKAADTTNGKLVTPPSSIYQLSFTLNNGNAQPLSAYKGKKILLVNTASDCGYTAQYDDLQKLQQQFKNELVVIGFPANDFKEQEKLNDDEIAQFCKLNFGVTFPLAKKSVVIKSPEQNPIFQWLSDAHKNGWCNQPPVWNFSKYLVDEEGRLTDFFDTKISPLSAEVVSAIEKK